MPTAKPSRTALGAAGHRAAHQVLEAGTIFADPLAMRILGPEAEAAIARARNQPETRALRLFIAMRSRVAEDALARAVEQGVRQLVVLGAGLDTYACRNPFGEALRVFEVDHPATQAWKREMLAAASIAIPSSATFTPVDFERDDLADSLAAAGFDRSQQTFFTWLGVVPYLTEDAIFATLGYIACVAGGAHVVFDYANPPDSVSDDACAAHEALAARVASAGEAFRTFFDTDALRFRLTSAGFVDIDDFGPARLAERFFPGRATARGDRGGHVVTASTR